MPSYKTVYLTVTYKYNDDGKTEDSGYRVEYGGKLSSRKPSDPIRSGYSFLGWFKNLKDETSFDFDTEIKEDTVLYAKWEVVKDEDSATLKFISEEDKDKGIKAFSYEYKFKKGSSVSLSSYRFTTDDDAYEIVKWSYGTGEGDCYGSSETIEELSEDLTLTAVWKEKTFTINFSFVGATFKEEKEAEHSGSYQADVKWGTKISDVFKDGTLSNNDEYGNYTLDYWIGEYPGTRYDVDYKITKSISRLYAVWKTEETRTVTFDYGYGDRKETATVTYGTAVSKPSRPVREGYSFVCWYQGENSSEFRFSNSVIKNDTTLIAKWEKVEHYTVTYMNVDFSTEYASEKVVCGKTAKGMVLPQLSGMEAVGWYRVDNSVLDYYGSPYDFSSPLQKDIVLRPKYIPSEETLTGTWTQNMGEVSVDFDFRKENGKNVLYITDLVYGTSDLVKAGTWNYDSDEGVLTLDADGINALLLNAMCISYELSGLGTAGESLSSNYTSESYQLSRTVPSETVIGSWKGSYGNWSVNTTFSGNTYDERRTLCTDGAGEGDVVAMIETNGNYVVETNYDKSGTDYVFFIDMENGKALGNPKSVFQSRLVVAMGSDSIFIAGLLGYEGLPLVRK